MSRRLKLLSPAFREAEAGVSLCLRPAGPQRETSSQTKQNEKPRKKFNVYVCGITTLNDYERKGVLKVEVIVIWVSLFHFLQNNSSPSVVIYPLISPRFTSEKFI